jgi:hypothetical protein
MQILFYYIFSDYENILQTAIRVLHDLYMQILWRTQLFIEIYLVCEK